MVLSYVLGTTVQSPIIAVFGCARNPILKLLYFSNVLKLFTLNF